MTKRQRAITTVFLVVALTVWCAGCPKSAYHSAVVAEHDFKIAVGAFQQAEIKESQAGRIDPAEHRNIEAVVERIGIAGEKLTADLQANANTTGVNADIAALLQVVDDLGGVVLKSQQSKAILDTAITTFKGILANIQVLLTQQPATGAKP